MNSQSRYERQSLLPQIGAVGQKKIAQTTVAIVGIGALGSVSADLLARAGVGRLRLIDRDFLELNNLQRQVLFDEEDLRKNLPKAVAAQRKLQKINSEIEIEAEPADLNPETVDELLEDVHLVVDGTDNFETRFLMNDFCLREKLPWIYGGAVGTEGLTYVILPGVGPCLRCLFEEAPVAGEFETCDTAGILAPVAHVIASFQAMEALKIRARGHELADRRLWKIDLWKKDFKPINVGAGFPRPAGLGRGDRASTPCSGCQKGDFPYLNRERASRTVTLCGRNAVQIFRSENRGVDFQNLAKKLSASGAVTYNEYLLKASIPPFEITLFNNGRAIIQGTQDAGQAKSIYAKYVGA